jgi:hypothetical protein
MSMTYGSDKPTPSNKKGQWKRSAKHTALKHTALKHTALKHTVFHRLWGLGRYDRTKVDTVGWLHYSEDATLFMSRGSQ